MGENVPSPLHVFLRRIGGDGGQPSFRPELECLTWNRWTSVSPVPVASLRALATRNRCHSLDLTIVQGGRVSRMRRRPPKLAGSTWSDSRPRSHRSVLLPPFEGRCEI